MSADGSSASQFLTRVTSHVTLVCMVLGAVGCSQRIPHADKERADVVLKITYGGAPITAGDVDLNNLQTGEGGGGPLDQTGTVRIAGVVLGDYVVTVQPPTSGALPGGDTSIAKSHQIHRKFQTPEQSPLKLTVHVDGAEATFDLKQ